jgi:hypothetical protein
LILSFICNSQAHPVKALLEFAVAIYFASFYSPHVALINRISALTKLFSASPQKRNKYAHKIIPA